jgi:transposase InsO family protein
LYGQLKITAHLRRTSLLGISRGAVDRAMRLLGLSGVRRSKKVRTTLPGKDGKRAGDLLKNRDFTARPQPRLGGRFHLRPHLGRVLPRRIHRRRVRPQDRGLARRHRKVTELVMTPLRIGLWQAGRDGHPTQPGQLICHSDAGSQYTAIRYAERLVDAGALASIGSVGDSYDCEDVGYRQVA